jgi:hypothetical protein
LAVLFFLCLAALGIVATRHLGDSLPASVSCLIPALFFAVYSAGIVYLRITSDIGFEERMFAPVVPVLLLILAAVCSRWRIPARRQAMALGLSSTMVAAYGASNWVESSLTQMPARHLEVQAAVSGEIRAILDRDPRPVVSGVGQAAGYGLNHPVVGMVGAEYSKSGWTERDVHDLMQRYGSCHLLLFPGIPTFDGQLTSQFLQTLMAGQHPSWLRVEARNERAILYESECGADASGNRPY